MNRRKRNIYIVLGVLLLLVFLLSLMLGSTALAPSKVLFALFGQGSPIEEAIVWTIRLPRAVTALLAGAGLALSGLLMQTFFRNPIAGPFVLGISGGAGLGAAIWIMGAGWLVEWGLLSAAALYNSWALVLAASLGAVLVLGLLLLVAWKMRDINTLLILGLMLGSAISAIVMILQFFSGRQELQQFVFWSMGNLGGVSWQELWILAPIVLGSLLYAVRLAAPLNVLLLGEDYARSMGVRVKRLRWQLIVLTAILAGSITAFCGPIAFVGIAVPHVARMLWKTQQHQLLITGSVLLGMLVLLGCQLLAQLPLQDQLLPINAVTALMGAPVVVWIVYRLRRYN